MKFLGSIHARVVMGALLVLLAFLAVAGLAVERAHEKSALAARFARVQSTVYLLIARAELDDGGALVMPATLAEPRLSLPASGLYASITNVDRGEEWQAPSTLGVHLPFVRDAAIGQWRYDNLDGKDGAFLVATYGVKWSDRAHPVSLVFSV